MAKICGLLNAEGALGLGGGKHLIDGCSSDQARSTHAVIFVTRVAQCFINCPSYLARIFRQVSIFSVAYMLYVF